MLGSGAVVVPLWLTQWPGKCGVHVLVGPPDPSWLGPYQWEGQDRDAASE